jgi:hypothetical protein
MEQNHFTCSADDGSAARHSILLLHCLPPQLNALKFIILRSTLADGKIIYSWSSGLGKRVSHYQGEVYGRDFCSPYTCHTKGITPAPNVSLQHLSQTKSLNMRIFNSIKWLHESM